MEFMEQYLQTYALKDPHKIKKKHVPLDQVYVGHGISSLIEINGCPKKGLSIKDTLIPHATHVFTEEYYPESSVLLNLRIFYDLLAMRLQEKKKFLRLSTHDEIYNFK